MEGEISTQDWSRDFNIQQSISAGLEDDVERIVYKVFDEFEKHSGPRFNIFTEVWHQTGLGLIFSGRESFREMFEFTEELFLRVKKYALSTLGGSLTTPSCNMPPSTCSTLSTLNSLASPG